MLYKIKRQVTDACRVPRGMQNDFFLLDLKQKKLSKSIFFFQSFHFSDQRRDCWTFGLILNNEKIVFGSRHLIQMDFHERLK